VGAHSDGETIMQVLTDGDGYRRQAEAFARVIREGRRLSPDVYDGLAALQLIEATATAVECGRGDHFRMRAAVDHRSVPGSSIRARR
jgi:predicted dehydrogenase